MSRATVTFNDLSKKEYDLGTTFKAIADDYQPKMQNAIIGAKIGNKVIELSDVLKKDCKIEFVDYNDRDGYKMYQSGLKFILIVALKELYGESAKVKFEHSIDRGIMCNITNGKPITEAEINELLGKMQEIVAADIHFEKHNVRKKEAVIFYENRHETEKALNVQNISNSIVVLYKLKNEFNYFYTDMPYSTGSINLFNIKYLEENKAVLLFPYPGSDNQVPEFTRADKIIGTFEKGKEFLEKVNVRYIPELNKIVSDSEIQEFIRVDEHIYNSNLDVIAEIIYQNRQQKRIVLISGPSSSGKTTSTKKLSLFLKAKGIKSLVLSVDDYFVEREQNPRNEKGEYDFETIEAIDRELFNKHLIELLEGKEVLMPKYNFLVGKKEYGNKTTKIDEDTILLLEGIHCLNEELTSKIARVAKYKIYLSPFTPLSIDRHNHVSTIDLRLLRRMIRDNRTRGFDVINTMENWQKVRYGEEKYIFPFINDADVVLNTALIYELGVLKVYAEPLLYSVPVSSEYYEEARRLLSYLKNFYPIPSEYVLEDSILREFIGNSVFE